MLLDGDFYFRGAVRSSWIFASPNEFAAVLACMLPGTWASGVISRRHLLGGLVHRSAWLKHLVSGVTHLPEIAIWLLLASTASRGGAVAAFAGVLCWCLFSRRVGEWIPSALFVGWRLTLCMLGFVLFSFSGRISTEYLSQDASIGNRFILWEGGLRLIALRPWNGWGTGESGEAFMQWIQPLDRGEVYRTMVNAYLHIGVERGILAFIAVVLVAVFPMLIRLYWRPSRGGLAVLDLATASACSWSVFAVVNVFSTLVFDWRLWIVPGAAMILLIWVCPMAGVMSVSWRRLLFAATVCSCVPILLVLYFWPRSYDGLYIRSESRSVVVFTVKSAVGGPVHEWGIVPDPAVLGAKYGHELRRWAYSASLFSSWQGRVYNPRIAAQLLAKAPPKLSWLLFGENAALADLLPEDSVVVFCHPTGSLPKRWKGSGRVLLPSIDENGSRERWAAWSVEKGLEYFEMPGVGSNALESWPSAYLDYLK